MPHCDTSVSSSNTVSIHLHASGIGTPPQYHHINCRIWLQLREMKCKICSLESLSWWSQPAHRDSSGRLWVCSVMAANPSVMNVAHKNVNYKKGGLSQEGCSYLMPLLHLLLTWCADAWSCPVISYQDLVVWGEGEGVFGARAAGRWEGFLTACWVGCCTGVDAAGSNAIKAFLVDDKESRKVVINMHISVIDKLCCLLCANVLHGQHLF